MDCLKVKGKDWAGGFVRVGLVLFALFLTASLGILMMERSVSYKSILLNVCLYQKNSVQGI